MINNKNISIITLDKKNIVDFSYERNNLLKNSKTPWILFLDKDEKLTHKLEKEILNEITNKNNLYNGFYIKRKIVFLDKIIGEDKVLRLAKKGAGKWIRAVHETWQINGNTKTPDEYIIHTTATNLKDYINKINFHSSIHALENKKEGKKANLVKIIFFPVGKLFYNIIIGRGFVFSIMQALHSFLSWTKLYFLSH